MMTKKEIKLNKVLTFYYSKRLLSTMTDAEKQYITNLLNSTMDGTFGNFRITVERIQ